MRRTPLTRKTPLRDSSRLPRQRPVVDQLPPPPMDLEAARAAMEHQAASRLTPRGDARPVPKPEPAVRTRPQGFSTVVRQTILDRDHMCCVRCGVPIDASTVGYSLQHRNARGMGGTSDPRINMTGNGIVLCGSATTGCHGKVEGDTTGEAERFGWAVASWADPVTVPVMSMRDGWVRLDNNGNRWKVNAPDGGDAHADAQRMGASK